MSSFLSRFTTPILVVLAIFLTFVYYRISGVPALSPASWPDLLFYFGLAFGVYLLAVLYVRFFWGKTFFSPELFIGTGLVFRLLFIGESPVLSGDLYRYLWDGRVANAGINPYRYPPASDNLKGIRDNVLYPKVSQNPLPAVHPPLMQILFQTITAVSESPVVFKSVLLAFELAAMLFMVALLKLSDRPLGWIVVFAWNPLAILETSWSGHADIVGIFFLVLALWLAVREQPLLSSIPLAFSALFKYLTLPLIPFLDDLRSRWKVVLAITGIVGVVMALGFWVYDDAGPSLFAGFKTFAGDWTFNGAAYPWLVEHLKTKLPMQGVVWGWVTDQQPMLVAKLILGGTAVVIYLIVYVYYLTRRYSEQRRILPWIVFFILAWILLLNPALHPWYLLWIIPLLCLYPNPAWLWLTGSVFISYYMLTTAEWRDDADHRLWEFAPFYLILIVTFLVQKIRQWRSHPEAHRV